MSFQSLNHVLKTFEDNERWRSHQQFKSLRSIWPQIVGPVVAQQTEPFSIQRQVLLVAVSSAAWAQNLMFERQRILEKLNETLSNNLADIRFSTAYWQRSQTLKSDLKSGGDDLSNLGSPDSAQSDQPSAIDESSSSPKDPTTAFQQWADAIQMQSQSLPLCPHCQCPTPTEELKRWDVCSLCAAQQWA